MSKAEPIYGLDISEHQRGMNLSTLKGQGYRFVFLRCTGGLNRDGSIYKDSTYRAFSEAASRAGLLQGCYHFVIEKPAKQQVDAFLAVAGDLRNKAIMLDFELYGPAPKYSPTNKTLRDVIAELRSRGIKKPILIYSGKSYWQEYGTPSGPLSSYGEDLVAWDAYYPLGTQVGYGADLYAQAKTYGWGVRWGAVEPRVWQFTGYGTVAGYSGAVDLNAFQGTLEELVGYTKDSEANGSGEVEPPVTPKPQDDWPAEAPPKEPWRPVRQGNYQDRHPTRYDWRDDVEGVVYNLFKTFRRISINTYVDHPATEINGPIYGGRDRTSFDVWDIRGRNYKLGSILGDAIVTYLMNDPRPPMIDWIIWERRMWTRASGRWTPFGTDAFSYHDDHVHCTFVGPQRR